MCGASLNATTEKRTVTDSARSSTTWWSSKKPPSARCSAGVASYETRGAPSINPRRSAFVRLCRLTHCRDHGGSTKITCSTASNKPSANRKLLMCVCASCVSCSLSSWFQFDGRPASWCESRCTRVARLRTLPSATKANKCGSTWWCSSVRM